MAKEIQKRRINKHPEFDDPLIEDDNSKSNMGFQMERAPQEDMLNKDMNMFLRLKSEASFVTNSESKLAQYSVKLSQETTMHVINMMINIVQNNLYNQYSKQDPSYSVPLTDYLFGDDKQVFINCIFGYLMRIYHSDDFLQESIEFMNILIK